MRLVLLFALLSGCATAKPALAVPIVDDKWEQMQEVPEGLVSKLASDTTGFSSRKLSALVTVSTYVKPKSRDVTASGLAHIIHYDIMSNAPASVTTTEVVKSRAFKSAYEFTIRAEIGYSRIVVIDVGSRVKVIKSFTDRSTSEAGLNRFVNSLQVM